MAPIYVCDAHLKKGLMYLVEIDNDVIEVSPAWQFMHLKCKYCANTSGDWSLTKQGGN